MVSPIKLRIPSFLCLPSRSPPSEVLQRTGYGEAMEEEMKEKNNQLMPSTLQDKLVMASTLVKSGLMPPGLNTPEKVLIALQMGHELGLKPMVSIQNIVIINNRPTLKADILSAVAMNSGLIEDIKIEYIGNEHEDSFGCKVTVKRKDIATPFTAVFTRKDAKTAGLYNKDNWRRYEKRMLKHRAMAYALRDAVSEVFAGIYIPDEIEYVPAQHYPEIEKITSEEEIVIDGNNNKDNNLATDAQIKAIWTIAKKSFNEDEFELFYQKNYAIESIKDLTFNQACKLIKILQNEPHMIKEWIDENNKVNDISEHALEAQNELIDLTKSAQEV